MPISFVETTAKSTTWPVRLDADLAFLEVDNVLIQNLPRNITLTTINPGVRSSTYSTWDFIFSSPITELERNSLIINIRGIFRIRLTSNPSALTHTDLDFNNNPGDPPFPVLTPPIDLTKTVIEKVSTDGINSTWQIKFLSAAGEVQILTGCQLESLRLRVTVPGISPINLSRIEDFGIGETQPQAMAGHGNPSKLYFVGNITNYLSTLDKDTGEATRVGTATNYGLGSTAPNFSDLASDGTNLYAISGTSTVEGLYTIDPSNGTAQKIEDLPSGETNPTGLAWAGPTVNSGNDLYLIGTGGEQTDKLYTLNKVDGSEISNKDLSIELASQSLDYINDIIYALATHPKRSVFKVDSGNGQVTRIGTKINFDLDPPEEEPRGIAHLGSKSYMIGATTNKLYELTLTGGNAGQAKALEYNISIIDQPETTSISYLRLRFNSNQISATNISIQGLPIGVHLVSAIKEVSENTFSIWDLRFSRDLTRLEIRSLVITVSGVTNEDGILLSEQPLTDTTEYINPLTRLPANTQTFFDGVRYLLSVDLTPDDLPNEVIAHDAYLGAASRYVAAQLKLTDQSTFDSYSGDYKARILNAIQNRVAAKLVPALPQIIEAEILESQVRYAEVDWQQKIVLLLNEANSLIDDLTPEEDLYGSGVSPFTKTGIPVSF